MRATHLARTALDAAISVLALAACADSAPGGDGATSSPPEPDVATGPSINWEFPYGPEVPTVASLEEAAAELSFKLVVPSFAKPDVIQLSPSELAQTPDDRSVVMIFRLPDEGPSFSR